MFVGRTLRVSLHLQRCCGSWLKKKEVCGSIHISKGMSSCRLCSPAGCLCGWTPLCYTHILKWKEGVSLVFFLNRSNVCYVENKTFDCSSCVLCILLVVMASNSLWHMIRQTHAHKTERSWLVTQRIIRTKPTFDSFFTKIHPRFFSHYIWPEYMSRWWWSFCIFLCLLWTNSRVCEDSSSSSSSS